jgi:transcriptional regulator GlxA family with amidase domain
LKIAVIVFDGFSVMEVGLVTEVFLRANQVSQAMSKQRGAKRFSVMLLSVKGGFVLDSLSVQVRTESIHDYSTETFDGVFVIGGANALRASEDSNGADPLRTFLAKAGVVKWDRIGKVQGAMTSPPSAKESAAAHRPVRGRADAFLIQSGGDMESLLAVTLSVLKGDLRTRVESQMLQRMKALHDGVGVSSKMERDESDWIDRIRAGAKWLRENYKRSISIAQAAEGVGMSERTFLRRFKTETSVTPSEYLLGVRLEAVCCLLIETSLPVDKIARRCGMGGGERLSRVFRRRFSLTPTEFRAANAGFSGAQPSDTE